MIIKLSFPNHEHQSDLSQFTGNAAGDFAGCSFRLNDNCEEADAWFIFEDVVASDSVCNVPEGQVFFLSAETGWSHDKFLRPSSLPFFRQFGGVFSCYAISGGLGTFAPPFLPWMINGNAATYFAPHERDINYFKQLESVEKKHPLSVICSSQTWTPHHRLRLEFVKYLVKELGDDIEWFGRGIREITEKWEGLASFERTLVLENQISSGVYSEKILDPFLSLTGSIYGGAPDIHSYLPVAQRNTINIADFDGSLEKIRKIIAHPPSNQENDSLMQGKEQVLSDLHFLNRVAALAKFSRSKRPGKLGLVRYQLNNRSSFSTAPPEPGSIGRRVFERMLGR